MWRISPHLQLAVCLFYSYRLLPIQAHDFTCLELNSLVGRLACVNFCFLLECYRRDDVSSRFFCSINKSLYENAVGGDLPCEHLDTEEEDEEGRDDVDVNVACTCQECDDGTLQTYAGDYTCGARIEWLKGRGLTEIQACKQVAQLEFPLDCGPRCDPDRCDGRRPVLTPSTPLYCFPPYDSRLRWENVWGDFIMEVKESNAGQVCGPGNNKFTRNTVNWEDDELTLQFRKVGNDWEASEVRLTLPEEQMPFTYGTFRFSVKRVVVKDTVTGVSVAGGLPPSITLGLFTWDSTEIYAIHENWNHEVDVELARWSDPTADDAQFLVQPPVDPQFYRFSTKLNGNLHQAPHSYEFTWGPNLITWYSDAGGGQFHSYGTVDALGLGKEDYVQCLPANVEVRLNLWHVAGNARPMDINDGTVVEVVIDDFQYIPSGITGLDAGGTCSKDCQCDGDMICVSNACSSPGTNETN